MKIAGIILIVFQLLAYLSRNFDMSSSNTGHAIGYFLGYNAFGIIGIILLLKAGNNKAKKKEAENGKVNQVSKIEGE
jgi:hypothetical protein